MIIALIGLAQSGKDAAADYLVKNHNFAHFNFSDVIAEECRKRGLDESKESRAKVGTALRDEYHDRGIIGALLVKKMKLSGASDIVLTGMRSPEELTILRKEYEKVVAVFVDCPLEARLKRRGVTDSAESNLKARDEYDKKSKGLGELIDGKMFDFKLVNDGTLEELYKKINELLTQFN